MDVNGTCAWERQIVFHNESSSATIEFLTMQGKKCPKMRPETLKVKSFMGFCTHKKDLSATSLKYKVAVTKII